MSRSKSSMARRPSPPRSRDTGGTQAAPLPAPQRAFFERAFGQDFSQVRLHTDPGAGMFARTLGAKAVTSNEDIAFAPGRYAPDSLPGRTLLAHELAHVVQQRQGGASDASEARARSAAQTVATGGQASAQSLGGAEPGGLHCDPDEDSKTRPEGPEPPPRYLVPPQVPGLQPPSLLQQPDWLKLRSSFDAHGLSMSDRDGDSIMAEWRRGSRLLDTFGIDDKFKLWFITKSWILNKGISMQLDQVNGRDHPNAMDRFDRDWSNAYPDDIRTPIIPIFDLDWFRKSSKK